MGKPSPHLVSQPRHGSWAREERGQRGSPGGSREAFYCRAEDGVDLLSSCQGHSQGGILGVADTKGCCRLGRSKQFNLMLGRSEGKGSVASVGVPG